jgi:lipopolysaccharide transport system ATP-binding protein
MSNENLPASLASDEADDKNAVTVSTGEPAIDGPVEIERRVMLELDNVSHSYRTGRKSFDDGTHHVLNQVSLKLYEGETLGIIGRNGVGKTTMLRLMAGILGPTHGKVRIHPGKSASLLTLGLGFRPELSGRDNAYLSAMLQGSTRKQARSFLPSIEEFSELGESFDEPVKDYSAGMRSRLAFTTALMTHVDILLIDEILSVGDAHFREKAQTAMKSRITGEQTVVFVSHGTGEVKSLCSRVIWLEKGKIVAEGDSIPVVDAYLKHVNESRVAAREKQVVATR